MTAKKKATSGTHKIRMKSMAIGPTGHFVAGQEYEVSAEVRGQFVEGGYAEDVASREVGEEVDVEAEEEAKAKKASK